MKTKHDTAKNAINNMRGYSGGGGSGFAGGSYTSLQILDFTGSTYDARLETSDPLIISSEDFSGGEAPVREFNNLRDNGTFILIDEYVDGEFLETKELVLY